MAPPRAAVFDQHARRTRPKQVTSDEQMVGRRGEDATVERRRIQVRLAQRAYRSRKETTLAELRNRVGELEKVVRDINVAIERCVRTTAATNASPEVKIHIRQLQEHCSDLANAAVGCSDSSNLESSGPTTITHSHSSIETGPDPATVCPDPSSTQVFGYNSLIARSITFGCWTTDCSDSPETDSNGLATILRSRSFVDAEPGSAITRTDPNQTPVFGYNTPIRRAGVSRNSTDFDILNLPANRVGLCHSSPELPHLQYEEPQHQAEVLPSHSQRVIALAMRINRVCSLHGLRLLMYPDQSLQRYEQAFGWSMRHGFDRAYLIQRFRKYLDLDPEQVIIAETETIDVPPSRYREIGNANPILPSSYIEHRDYNSTLECASSQNGTNGAIATISASNQSCPKGEWLDAHDVSTYLAQCGIDVDPSSRLVSVKMKLGEEPLASTVGSSSLERPSDQLIDTRPPDQIVQSMMSGISAPSQASTSTRPLDRAEGRHRSDQAIPGVSTGCVTTTTLTFDVAKLVQAICGSAICLGHKPGFKRHKVDAAIRAALVTCT